MKPGTLRPTDGSSVVFDQSTQVGEVDQVPTKVRVEVDQLPDALPSRLPQVDASRTETVGQSGLVRGRVDADADERPKGKRQKFLKVLDVKALPKAGKEGFRDLAQVLGGSVRTLRKRGDVSGDFGTEDA